MDHKEYDLRGRLYIQRPLVLGQIQTLLPLIEKIEFTEKSDAFAIMRALGEKVNYGLAIVLLEKGVDEPEPEKIKAAMERLNERVSEIMYILEGEQILEVIEDFFEFNRVSSIIEKLRKTIQKMSAQIASGASISSESSGESPEGTSPKGKASSGA